MRRAACLAVLSVGVALALAVGSVRRESAPQGTVPSSVAPAVTSGPVGGTELPPRRARGVTLEEWLAEPR